MDQFGQIGPEKGDYTKDVALVAALLAEDRTVTLALTHRMTRQRVTVARKESMVVFGEDRGGGPGGTRGGEFVYVSVDEKGAYWFRVDLKVDASYCASKLGINIVDAETLVEFLARIGSALGYQVVPGASTVTQLEP